MELRTEEWKEFKIGDLFEYERGKEAAPNQNSTGECPLISETSENNGFVRMVEPTTKFNDHCISVSVNFASVVFYQPQKFCASVNIIILRPSQKITKNCLLFIASVLSKKHRRYSYSDKVSKKILMDTKISLPEKNGEPDWDFMEEYISFIENRYIDKIDKKNKEKIGLAMEVTGITEEELDGELVIEAPERVEEFRVGDLFDVHKIKGINQEHLTDYTEEECYNYITRTSLNNGVHSKTGEVKSAVLQDKNTFSLGLLGMDFFYQRKPWYAGQFVRCITPKFEINNALATYFSVILNKRSELYKNDLIREFDSIFFNDTVSLPAIDESTPDFKYMENAIYIC